MIFYIFQLWYLIETWGFRMDDTYDLPQKLGFFFKRSLAPRGRGTCEYILKWA